MLQYRCTLLSPISITELPSCLSCVCKSSPGHKVALFKVKGDHRGEPLVLYYETPTVLAEVVRKQLEPPGRSYKVTEGQVKSTLKGEIKHD